MDIRRNIDLIALGASAIVAITVMLIASAYAEPVCHVVDGDTFDVCKTQKNGAIVKTRIRLWGVDAPEMRTPMGPVAKSVLANLLAAYPDPRLRCLRERDYFGRKVCRVLLPIATSEADLNKWLVRNGWAKDVPEYSTGIYEADQAEAQAEGLGIWSEEPAL